MVNFETNPEKIIAAHNSGLISQHDYEQWLSLQGYKNALKKSIDNTEISESVYQSEIAKVEGFYFERDFNSNQLKFILKGIDFDPLDLRKQNEVIKSIQQKPLANQTSSSSTSRLNNQLEKTFAIMAGLKKEADDMTKRLKTKF